MRRAYPAAPDRDRRTPLFARGAYDALVGRDAYTGGVPGLRIYALGDLSRGRRTAYRQASNQAFLPS
jgi:hypothetical protein